MFHKTEIGQYFVKWSVCEIDKIQDSGVYICRCWAVEPASVEKTRQKLRFILNKNYKDIK